MSSAIRGAAFAFVLLAFVSIARPDAPSRRVRITLERLQNGSWKAIDPGLVLNQGDRVRFRVESNFSGYAYVIDYGTSGATSVVFPSKDAGSDNKLQPGRSRQVPSGDSIFRVSGPPGQDVVYWIISPVELPGYGATPLNAEPPKPALLLPRCDDTLLRSRGECIDASAGARDLDPSATASDQKGSDLTFLREDKNSVIAASGSDSGPMLYQFRIAHK